MVHASRVAPCLFFLALMSTLIPTLLSVGLGAPHNSYVDQLFRDFERQPLDDQGRIALRALRNRFRQEVILNPPASKQEQLQRIDSVLLCASGLLDDRQYFSVTGSVKSPQQQMRYELRQMHREIHRLKQLTHEIQLRDAP
ncbi:MAG: hypothetical protein OSB09_03110 [Planctomycetota bacterium]|nr:hypothetical protein [Planctomycetota bacterium]